MGHLTKEMEKDGRDLQIKFSPRVTGAFADLAAAVHFSDHFDRDIFAIVQGWAAGKRQTAHDVLISLPAVAEETFKHIHATNDENARNAWDEIRNGMAEDGFALGKTSVRAK